MDGEKHLIANAANLSSLVWHALPDINWCGFYLYDGNELVVGPFQGKPACVRIALGRGVCGTAAQTRAIQIVDDVDAFDGHIPCDAASRSEIVVPLIGRNGALIGVWDVDSPTPGSDRERWSPALANCNFSAARNQEWDDPIASGLSGSVALRKPRFISTVFGGSGRGALRDCS